MRSVLNFGRDVIPMFAGLLIGIGTVNTVQAQEGPAGSEVSRLQERVVTLDNIKRFHVTSLGRVIEGNDSGGSAELGGGCPFTVTHTDANFTGGSFFAQAGFSEMEWAAVTYTVPASSFPMILKKAEMIFATSGSTVTTTTHWTIGVWEGLPSTGNQVAIFSSDDVILPHIVIPPGTNGVNVQFSVDPKDPDQIVIQDNGTHQFSIGYRIDDHNNQTQNPCFIAPPSGSNAFPTTDVSGLAQSANNWLFGVNCGALGCPANGGWARFSQLPGFCRPTGDWVIRAEVDPVTCSAQPGACCFGIGNCIIQTQSQCQQNSGAFGGPNSSCATFTCPYGACCLPDNSCNEETLDSCTAQNGSFRGVGVTCATASCATIPRVCCFPSTMACINNITPQNCVNVNGISGPPGSTCTNYVCFPIGACCLPSGACLDNRSPSQCPPSVGTFRGHMSTCANVICPIPEGACCVGTLGCIVINEFDCTQAIGGIYKGGGTNCLDGNMNGAPDICDGGCVADCNGDGDTNGADLSVLLGQFGTSVAAGSGADINNDGFVNAADLSVMLSDFGCN